MTLGFTDPPYYPFLAVVAGLMAVAAVRRNLRLAILAVGSYAFFYFASGFSLLILVAITVVDFTAAAMIHRSADPVRRKLYLAASVASNVLLLGFFKYAGFVAEIFNGGAAIFSAPYSLPVIDVLLPVGISFYTFESLSYTIDVYRRRIRPSPSILEYACFVAFFPKLVAGPIFRAWQLLPQFGAPLVFTVDNLRMGTTLILIGLVKKLVVADNLAPLVDEIFGPNFYGDSGLVFVGALAFGVQIYCDFSGYTDIAIGSARILGIQSPPNFIFPYTASSPREFWRRWHVTLSSWFRDYVYIPLGGGRRGWLDRNSNVLVTMAIAGLWHGAAWHFVLWGLYHGFLIVLQNTLEPVVKRIPRIDSRPGKLLAVLVTQYLVFLGWLLFREDDTLKLELLIEFYTFTFVNPGPLFYSFKFEKYYFALAVLPCFLLVHFVSWRIGGIHEKIARLRPLAWWAAVTVLALVVMFFKAPTVPDFIYFRF